MKSPTETRPDGRGPAARRGMSYAMLKRTTGGSNDSKSQISLEPGSEEYREYVRDITGVDDSEFVDASLVTDPKASRGRKLSDEEIERERDKDAGKEAEHVADLAGDLAEAGEAQAEQGADVMERKYRLRMAKMAQFGEMKEELTRAAAATSTKKDDAIAEKVSTRTVDDMPDIRDDDVSAEEYVPLARHRYF